jgi:hypothetical protein
MAEKKIFKRGQKVKWNSHAGGVWTEKKGTVIEVCRNRRVDVTQRTKVEILREVHDGLTIAKAKDRANYTPDETVLQKKYKLKFGMLEGYRDETPHYLVEVDRGEGRKPFLYHPVTENLFAR